MEPTTHRIIRIITVVTLSGLLLLTACQSFSFQAAQPTAAPTHESPHGPMAVFHTPSGSFEVDYPVEWDDAEGDDRRCGTALKCLISRQSEFMLVRESTLPGEGGAAALAEGLDRTIAAFDNETADSEFVSRTPVTLPSGLPAEVLRYVIEDGRVTVAELWAADGNQAVSIAFITWNEGFPALEPVAQYVFDSLRLAESE